MGATALVWVMTMSPPNASIVKTAGNSQYFLRTRKKAQNSAKKDKRNARTSNRFFSEIVSLRLRHEKRNGR